MILPSPQLIFEAGLAYPPDAGSLHEKQEVRVRGTERGGCGIRFYHMDSAGVCRAIWGLSPKVISGVRPTFFSAVPRRIPHTRNTATSGFTRLVWPP